MTKVATRGDEMEQKNGKLATIIRALQPIVIRLFNIDDKVILSSKARYIRIGLQPFDFEWLDDLPYTYGEEMQWDSTTGWHDIKHPNLRIYSIIDTATWHITEVHVDKAKRVFAWTFKEARGADGHPHPTGGAWWVTLNER